MMYIGIDLGTTNSAVAGYKNSKIIVYETSEGEATLPSVIYVNKSGHKIYGKRAYSQSILSPENVASGFKRLMGTATKIDLKASSLSLSAEECSADILKQLIGQVLTKSGTEKITGTVITIPAAFNQMQSEATIRSAEMAGLRKVALLQEPIAAALAAMSCTKKNGQFLVYDLGGGTFDLALVQSISGAINIIDHEGVNMLGGRDFDRSIVNSFVRPWLIKNFDLPHDFQKYAEYRRVIRIAHPAAEKAKIGLSSREKEVIFASDDEIRVHDKSGNDIFLDVEITRQNLEQLIDEEIQKTIDLSRTILKNNGYSHEDIDRVVFIGGSTKMPYLRKKVTQELGIPEDLQIDPLTAVAQGAAIYCESREWHGEKTTRKSSRASHKAKGEVNITYDYPSRSSAEKVKMRLKASDMRGAYEVQIDSASGWTSGRILISDKTSIDLYLNEMGDNAFRAQIFDESGNPVKEAGVQFIITRTHASSVGIPATQTIAVKVRCGLNSDRNKLITLLEKGTVLPAEGVQRLRAATALAAGKKGERLDFELYQDEGAPEPELNLRVGVFRLSGNDLEHGILINEGDEIIFHWKMSDSGLLKATVELPSVAQSFDTPKFYVDQAGHQSFCMNGGTALASSLLKDTEDDLTNLKEYMGDSSNEACKKIEDDLESQHKVLDNATEEDTIRGVVEKLRHMRQKISTLKHSPVNRGKELKNKIYRLAEIFDHLSRKNADSKIVDLFDTHKRHALECIDTGDKNALLDAERHLEEMNMINNTELWKNPDFLTEKFKHFSNEQQLATDPVEYQLMLQRGLAAIESNNMDALRRILICLHELQLNISGAEESINTLASIVEV